jgi:hypothetical protein
MPAKRGSTARVVFDDLAFNDDLGRTTDNGRKVALTTRNTYEQNGCPIDDLLACQEQAADGTDLPGCAKVYLPAPMGKFGMVFAIKRQEGQLVLVSLAFGVRHHPKGSHALNVYEIAHRRLHEIIALDLRGEESGTP